MKAENRNSLWSQVFVDELARSGLREVCVAPGSRSTPLTLAFAAHPQIKVYSHIDERSASFFALGLALAGERPVALLCTSGTATANFYPAVIEAHQANIPLLILTTDRPHELRDSGANQTIDQIKLYGNHVRWFVDVAPPEAKPSAKTVRYLRALAGRALAMANGLPEGPVHLNFPFRKPLEPVSISTDLPDNPAADLLEAMQGRADGTPFTRFSRAVMHPSETQIRTLVEAIQANQRGLIICGTRCPGGRFPDAVTRLARLSGYPILADGVSGIRFGEHIKQADGLILGGYENFLPAIIQAKIGWPPPELIIRFGAMPVGKAVSDYLEKADCQQITINRYGLWNSAAHRLTDFMQAEPEIVCHQTADRLENIPINPANSAWVDSFKQAEEITWSVIETETANGFFEGMILADTIKLLPAETLLYTASSSPIRHLDQFAPPNSTPVRIFANRGASGIDGTISSALGAAASTDRPLVLVTGDLTFYHDLNGLLALKRCGVKATIILINNDGGGIFQRLPISKFDPPFTELFLTPHGLDFEPIGRMYGAEYSRAISRVDFQEKLKKAIGAETTHIIEISSNSAQCEQQRREIMAKTAERIKEW